jgi:ribosome-associated heat shock protein Hsp15
LRLDKWLVHARFAKTRGIAARMIGQGRARINGRKIDKPDAKLRAGDVLTLGLDKAVAVVRVLALGERRGPSVEARLLYSVVTDSETATAADRGGMAHDDDGPVDLPENDAATEA